MEDAKQELKPCPFCGSTSLKVESKHNGKWSNTGTYSATVRCNKCHARGSTASCKVSEGTRYYTANEIVVQKAIDLWNNAVANLDTKKYEKALSAVCKILPCFCCEGCDFEDLCRQHEKEYSRYSEKGLEFCKDNWLNKTE